MLVCKLSKDKIIVDGQGGTEAALRDWVVLAKRHLKTAAKSSRFGIHFAIISLNIIKG